MLCPARPFWLRKRRKFRRRRWIFRRAAHHYHNKPQTTNQSIEKRSNRAEKKWAAVNELTGSVCSIGLGIVIVIDLIISVKHARIHVSAPIARPAQTRSRTLSTRIHTPKPNANNLLLNWSRCPQRKCSTIFWPDVLEVRFFSIFTSAYQIYGLLGFK